VNVKVWQRNTNRTLLGIAFSDKSHRRLSFPLRLECPGPISRVFLLKPKCFSRKLASFVITESSLYWCVAGQQNLKRDVYSKIGIPKIGIPRSGAAYCRGLWIMGMIVEDWEAGLLPNPRFRLAPLTSANREREGVTTQHQSYTFGNRFQR
jgi:hypothetical protein